MFARKLQGFLNITYPYNVTGLHGPVCSVDGAVVAGVLGTGRVIGRLLKAGGEGET